MAACPFHHGTVARRVQNVGRTQLSSSMTHTSSSFYTAISCFLCVVHPAMGGTFLLLRWRRSISIALASSLILFTSAALPLTFEKALPTLVGYCNSASPSSEMTAPIIQQPRDAYSSNVGTGANRRTNPGHAACYNVPGVSYYNTFGSTLTPHPSFRKSV